MVAKDPHGPNSLSNYFEVHGKVMRDFVASGFVIADGVATNVLGNGYITMEGTIECLGDIEIDVTKILEVLPQDGREPMVQTIEYHYNASVRGLGNVLRYDSPHPDHNRMHHLHRYDVFNGDNEGTVEECAWPTLGDVIGELEEWYWDNRDQLATPERAG